MSQITVIEQETQKLEGKKKLEGHMKHDATYMPQWALAHCH